MHKPGLQCLNVKDQRCFCWRIHRVLAEWGVCGKLHLLYCRGEWGVSGKLHLYRGVRSVWQTALVQGSGECVENCTCCIVQGSEECVANCTCTGEWGVCGKLHLYRRVRGVWQTAHAVLYRGVGSVWQTAHAVLYRGVGSVWQTAQAEMQVDVTVCRHESETRDRFETWQIWCHVFNSVCCRTFRCAADVLLTQAVPRGGFTLSLRSETWHFLINVMCL
jgi:hypothetical protein